ncbi:hypothetical protein GCM10011414_03220 [Croceivirga lutea]|uniref:GNAT family N-acetyltransferase n=1 Tax=Croceivirga lutea TaxID=1775167 RepID=UPI001639642F|nr:GNAT family N-acetyltransferase [Croceivirga lutea]GGG37186.1 hypothetical protein GCM10011414_03220 [Croceivirga lutea]
MVYYKRAETVRELEQILKIQNENLPNALTKPEIENEGFVTVCHTLEQLIEMNTAFPHTIAVYKESVVGYALSMPKEFGAEIEVLKPMFKKINEVYSDKSYIVMGQICITKAYRGKGLFRGLYSAMQDFTKPKFEAIITEVDTKNTRSINAHSAIGFKELTRYFADDHEWSLIVL